MITHVEKVRLLRIIVTEFMKYLIAMEENGFTLNECIKQFTGDRIDKLIEEWNEREKGKSPA